MRRWLLLGLAALLGAGPGLAWAKGPIHGLVTMGSLNFDLRAGMEPQNDLREANAHPGLYAGAVILATWEQLEPSPGRFDFSAIDRGLDAVRAYNARYRQTPLVAKLRIFAGLHAPGWVKALDGGPVTLHKRDASAPFAHFWSVPYRDAWRALQGALAARYDNDRLVAEVAVSSCSSTTAEPFIVPLTPVNTPVLVQAGYTEAGMEACLMGAVDDYAAWRNTAVDYTFNPWRTLEDGRPRVDASFTIQVMQAFRARFGARGVLANHGLAPEMNPGAQTVLDAMQRLGPPIEFQTRGPDLDWNAAVAAGEKVGMTELEIWNTRDAGGPAPVTADELRTWRTQLEH
jgi:hypothetical protein